MLAFIPPQLSRRPIRPPQPLASAVMFISVSLAFQECHINGTTQHRTFWGLVFPTQQNPLESHPGACVSTARSSLQQSSFPWCGCSLVCLTLRVLKDVWAASRFRVFCIKLPQTFLYRFPCEHKLTFLWEKCPAVQSLGCTVFTCLTFKGNCQTAFQSGRTISHSCLQRTSASVSLRLCQRVAVPLFSFISTSSLLIGV